jgi:hypothetical protein
MNRLQAVVGGEGDCHAIVRNKALDRRQAVIGKEFPAR